MKTYAFVPQDKIAPAVFDWGRLYWYVTGQDDTSNDQTLGKCVLNPGAANPRHYHPNCEEVLHVVSGTIDHYVDGAGWFAMGPGDSVTIAPNIWHCARNTGHEEAHLMIAFSSADRQTVGE
ncbi:MAG: cupin [Puniceicoccaceae bacterium 5H]|nr:MAG: cupin [Puniceicoccaceae bacterium 5H]